jgi:GDP-4-dehydro-6-deoxy-D-mannose reductase
MKSLIIGAAGFVGNYLVNELALNQGWDVTATKLPFEKIDSTHCTVFDLDILDEQAIFDLLVKEKPGIVYHLAAQSSVALSWAKPGLTADVNIRGAVNLLEAIRRLDYKIRVILIGSSEEYGAAPEAGSPIKETHPANPRNIYAITKYTQNMLGMLYAKAYNIDTICVRAFNHTGPGQAAQFVLADFCKQAAEIKLGKKEPVIYTGNLSAKRDFTDVRDIVRAYALLGIKGRAGETYNVGSGKAVEIGEVLKKIIALSGAAIEIRRDEKKFRPVEQGLVRADISKLREATGWSPEIPLEQTLQDMLEWPEINYGKI